jgi:hypothetical protein
MVIKYLKNKNNKLNDIVKLLLFESLEIKIEISNYKIKVLYYTTVHIVYEINEKIK